jgi:hypothetical protein
MEAGDRVMVYDSPGEPLNHYLYATVLSAAPKGALVLIDHPGNPTHGNQKWTPIDKIMTAADALTLADETRKKIPLERDPDRRKKLFEAVKNHEFVATQLT